MNLFKLVMPLGIATYLLALLTIISGLKKAKLTTHKLLATLTIILATCHAGLIIYLKVLR